MAVQLTIETREEAGSCNFCQRGTPNEQQTNLVFPYANVALLSSDLARGTGSVRLCPECLVELGRQLGSFTWPAAVHA